jgi:hypothetical protein
MKTIFNLFVIVSLVLLSLPGFAQKDPCSRTIGKITKDNKAPISGACDTPYDTGNEYDSVGIWHNLAMEYIAAHSTFETWEAAYETAGKFIHQTFGANCTAVPGMPDAQTVRNATGDPAGLRDLVTKTPFSEKSKSYLSRLLDLFTDPARHYAAYCDLKTEIVALERTIRADAAIDAIELANLQSITSVARHSAHYWYNYFLSASAPAKFRLFRWLFVAVFDVGGAIAGSLLGPVGTVTTAVLFSAGAAGATTP